MAFIIYSEDYLIHELNLTCLFVFVQVVEEPYTMREARIHVRHVRDLLKSLDPADAYNGVDCSSLSFLNVITQGDILGIYKYSIPYQSHKFTLFFFLICWNV
jgi:hypothetical protein